MQTKVVWEMDNLFIMTISLLYKETLELIIE